MDGRLMEPTQGMHCEPDSCITVFRDLKVYHVERVACIRPLLPLECHWQPARGGCLTARLQGIWAHGRMRCVGLHVYSHMHLSSWCSSGAWSTTSAVHTQCKKILWVDTAWGCMGCMGLSQHPPQQHVCNGTSALLAGIPAWVHAHMGACAHGRICARVQLCMGA